MNRSIFQRLPLVVGLLFVVLSLADPTLAAPWDKYGKPFWYDAEGWRRFLEWAEEHPREVLDARERAARKNFAREAREHAHAERERRRHG